MKRFLTIAAFILAFCTALPAYGLGKLQGFVETGGQSVVSNMTGAATKVVRSYPNALVTVYETGTTTLATLYSDDALTAKSNPFTSDTQGYYQFYIADGCYDLRFSGGGISTPFTRSYICTNGVAAENDPRRYGLIADGSSHPLSSQYGSLAAAKAAYPLIADQITALTQEIDWCALQTAFEAAGSGYYDSTPVTFTITATNGSKTITASAATFGTTTEATPQRIEIAGVAYVLERYSSASGDTSTQARLTVNYAGTTASGISTVLYRSSSAASNQLHGGVHGGVVSTEYPGTAIVDAPLDLKYYNLTWRSHHSFLVKSTSASVTTGIRNPTQETVLYHVHLNDVNVEIAGAAAGVKGIDLTGISYSRLTKPSVTISNAAASGICIYLGGNVAATGPYYNFITDPILNGVDNANVTGIQSDDATTGGSNAYGGNATTVVGGRIAAMGTAVNIENGLGNAFLNVTTERIVDRHYSFGDGATAGSSQGNRVIASYAEGLNTSYFVRARTGAFNNLVQPAFATTLATSTTPSLEPGSVNGGVYIQHQATWLSPFSIGDSTGFTPVSGTVLLYSESSRLKLRSSVHEQGVNGSILTKSTSTSTTGTGSPEDLWSIPLTANTLTAAGDTLVFEVWGTAAANANVKTLAFAFGASTVTINNVTTAPNGNHWWAKWTIMRSTATTQSAVKRSEVGGAQQGVLANDPGQTLTGALTLKVTGNAAAGDLTITGGTLELKPAP